MRHVRWCIRSWQTIPSMKWQTNVDSHASSTETNFFSSHQRLAFHCVWVSAKHRTSPTPIKPTPKGSESKITPWKDSGLVITQCQASKTSLGWINGELWLLQWTSTGACTEDRWRLQVTCSGSGCLQDHMHLAEGVDVSNPSMLSDSRLNDCHYYSWNWVTVARQ